MKTSTSLDIHTFLRNKLSTNISFDDDVNIYEKQYKELYDIINRTAFSSEGNSMLIVGPRGCGKTKMMKSVIKDLEKKEDFNDSLIQVHLNGLLQTNDRIALLEITRQLALENTVGDKVFGSFSENLQFLLDALKSGGKHSKSILFVLDEFSMFTSHHNQTLLYNLFDISQSAQTPVCVIGITSRMDVISLLEKRVKSRFSHRQLYMLNEGLSCDSFCRLFERMLCLPSDCGHRSSVVDQWNSNIKEIVKADSIQGALKNMFAISSNLQTLQQLAMLVISSLDSTNPTPQASDIIDAHTLINCDSKASVLRGLSVLELCLIIAMKHINELHDGDPFNFEMVYKEYHKFTSRKMSVQSFEKPVVMKAFEHLCMLELVTPLSGGIQVQKQYRQMCLQVDESQVLSALNTYPGHPPTEVIQWGRSSAIA